MLLALQGLLARKVFKATPDRRAQSVLPAPLGLLVTPEQQGQLEPQATLAPPALVVKLVLRVPPAHKVTQD